MRHLLVTNDFPPKVGGIQSYLWELWRRLDPAETFVYTTPYRGAAHFDAEQPYWIERSREPALLPNPVLLRRVNRLAERLDIDLILLDPGLPLGLIGPWLERPYGVVAHGAEVAVPGRLPGTRQLLGRVLRGAVVVIAAGGYPAAEADHAAGQTLPTVVIPPGVDIGRFSPPTAGQRQVARAAFDITDDDLLVVSLSRLVPRKGMDTLIRATAELRKRRPELRVLIAGAGRDRDRLGRLVAGTAAPVDFLGRIPDDQKVALLGAADLFAMLCRTRWAGLEQEGFGIVFAEAGACGVPAVSGHSGGAHEAVEDGVTGLVVEDPTDAGDVADAMDCLLADTDLRLKFGLAARERAVTEFSYDKLATQLGDALHRAVATRGIAAANGRPS